VSGAGGIKFFRGPALAHLHGSLAVAAEGVKRKTFVTSRVRGAGSQKRAAKKMISDLRNAGLPLDRRHQVEPVISSPRRRSPLSHGGPEATQPFWGATRPSALRALEGQATPSFNRPHDEMVRARVAGRRPADGILECIIDDSGAIAIRDCMEGLHGHDPDRSHCTIRAPQCNFQSDYPTILQ